MSRHVLQSQNWADFKNAYGTPAIMAGGVMYTKHHIPLARNYYAYCPRVNPHHINFEELKKSLEDNDCIAIHFDVPNVTNDSDDAVSAERILSERCVLSPRDEFARGNFILDLTPAEDVLLQGMHKKHRYNVNYAKKNGVEVKRSYSIESFDEFYALYSATGIRQKYYYRPEGYLRTMWQLFNKAQIAHILTAYYNSEPLASWILFSYDNVLYYPYGGSSEEHRNFQASCLLGWEAMMLGKELGCSVFDMWGASEDMSKEDDSYRGFSVFKQKFGARHVTYINSYDYVLNQSMYALFNTANTMRWKVLKVLR